MPYLKKVCINNNSYYYLFHTVRDKDKFKKLSRYIGKKEPSKRELEKLKQEFLEKINKKYKPGKKEEKSRVNLLNIFKEIRGQYGYLPENIIRKLSKKIKMHVVEIYSAATFYSMLSVKKKGRNIVRICSSPSCFLNGSLNILEGAKKILGIDINETTKDGKFSLESTSCIGCCDKAPAIMINDKLITNLTREKLRQLLK